MTVFRPIASSFRKSLRQYHAHGKYRATPGPFILLRFQTGQFIEKDHAVCIDTLTRGAQHSHGTATVMFSLVQTRVGDFSAYGGCGGDVRIIAASLKEALIESEVY